MATQYYTATTLDGYLADDQHRLDWLFEVEGDTDHATDFARFFSGVGAMVMGASTYEWVLEHEKLLDEPEKWRGFYGDLATWVFTHRDLPVLPGANLTLAAGDVAEVFPQMVQAAGEKNIWLVGGGDLVGQFADRGLLDEILLSVAPVTLGSGAPLLPRRLRAADLRLESVERNGQFAVLSYRLPSRGHRADR